MKSFVGLGLPLLILFVGIPTDVSAHSWLVDDGCAPGPSPGGLFYAGGDEWFINYTGYGSCHMLTLNNDQVRDEWAEWYLPAYSVPNPGNYNHYYDIWN